jgi:hypothetical protein
MRAFERSRSPSAYVAQPERYTGRAAHPSVAVNHDSLGVRPRVDEIRDLTRVILGKKNIRRLATLGDVVEAQSKNSREARRDSSRWSIGVRDRNADLRPARLIALGIIARENDELRSQYSPSGSKWHCASLRESQSGTTAFGQARLGREGAPL